MNKLYKYIALASVVVTMTACDDLFEPAIQNINDMDAMTHDSESFDGVLGSAYILMPYSSGPVNDVATDDAVSNDMNNTYLEMAGGAWTSQTGVSTDNWRDRNASINYTNLVLENAHRVEFAKEAVINQGFTNRLRGEAFGLRALNLYFLLQNYGGYSADGELLGVPIWTHSFDATTPMDVARAPFSECIQQIFADVDSCVALLPLDYADIDNESKIPAVYRNQGMTIAGYNRVFGGHVWCRMTARIAEAIRAQAALLAASPAFSAGSGVDWATAANYAANVLNANGGIAGLCPTGHIWYSATEIGNQVDNAKNHAEIIWRDNYGDKSCTIESDNYPPSLHGKGRVNPTQNLVDAFPMLNGYPINDPKSGYNANDPYSNRDPRLNLYIVVNGAKEGLEKSQINTAADNSFNNDGLNREQGYSTRTGYYMRKLLREDAGPTSSSSVVQYHYTKRIRYTEIYLAYAEAANEAWGPKSGGNNSFSAYDVIKAIRARAGITGVNGSDAYLEAAAASKETMRELIRNERRLELCFENLRFWDIRRWNDKATLSQPAYGIEIKANVGTKIEVEPRNFKDFQIYGPLPYSDILKFGNLKQNQGW